MTEKPPATILIVDDNEEIAKLLEEFISPMGDYKIVKALSGKEALDIVERQPPDLIFLDIMMEDMDGKEVCRALKSNEKTSRIPVIAATVIRKRVENDYQAIMDSGVDDYIEKPFSFYNLQEIIKKHLNGN